MPAASAASTHGEPSRARRANAPEIAATNATSREKARCRPRRAIAGTNCWRACACRSPRTPEVPARSFRRRHRARVRAPHRHAALHSRAGRRRRRHTRSLRARRAARRRCARRRPPADDGVPATQTGYAGHSARQPAVRRRRRGSTPTVGQPKQSRRAKTSTRPRRSPSASAASVSARTANERPGAQRRDGHLKVSGELVGSFERAGDARHDKFPTSSPDGAPANSWTSAGARPRSPSTANALTMRRRRGRAESTVGGHEASSAYRQTSGFRAAGRGCTATVMRQRGDRDDAAIRATSNASDARAGAERRRPYVASPVSSPSSAAFGNVIVVPARRAKMRTASTSTSAQSPYDRRRIVTTATAANSATKNGRGPRIERDRNRETDRRRGDRSWSCSDSYERSMSSIR